MLIEFLSAATSPSGMTKTALRRCCALNRSKVTRLKEQDRTYDFKNFLSANRITKDSAFKQGYFRRGLDMRLPHRQDLSRYGDSLPFTAKRLRKAIRD